MDFRTPRPVQTPGNLIKEWAQRRQAPSSDILELVVHLQVAAIPASGIPLLLVGIMASRVGHILSWNSKASIPSSSNATPCTRLAVPTRASNAGILGRVQHEYFHPPRQGCSALPSGPNLWPQCAGNAGAVERAQNKWKPIS